MTTPPCIDVGAWNAFAVLVVPPRAPAASNAVSTFVGDISASASLDDSIIELADCTLSSSLGLLVRPSSTGSSSPPKERTRSDGRSARSAPGMWVQQAKGGVAW